MFLQAEFVKIQAELGVQFTLDACANPDGSNALCTNFCSTANSFLKSNVAGQCVWMNPPYTAWHMYKFIRHYLRCKASDPAGTSACIVVPKWQGKFRHLLQHMQLVKEYDAGSILFSAPNQHGKGRHVMKGTPWPVQVFYDAPCSPDKFAAVCNVSGIMDQPLTMMYDGSISGKSAKVLVDSGASHVFIDQDFVQHNRIHVRQSSVGWVRVGNNGLVKLQGECTVRLQLGAYKATVTALVMPTVIPGVNVLLGDQWLTRSGGVLDYEQRCLSVKKGDHRVTIQACKTLNEQDVSPDGIIAYVCSRLYEASGTMEVYNMRRAKRAIRKGAAFINVLVKETSAGVEIGPVACAVQATVEGDIDDAWKAKLQGLFNEYETIFGESKFPPDRGIGHAIPLVPGYQPPYAKMYRMSPKELEVLRSTIKELLAKGYIEPSTSPFGANCMLVAKKDGSYRLVQDYRQLNAITVPNRYPLPNITELFDQLQGKKWYSCIDLQSGYYQIRITPEDSYKTAFRTCLGHFQFKVLAMGLANAPSTFQSVMNKMFQEHLGKFVFVYLDDICVASETLEEHLQHLETVFKILKENEFYVKLSKCEWLKREVKFLGHIVGQDGLKVDPDKTAVVRDWAVPKDAKALRSFLGLANYFRRFVRGYASLVAPLNELLRNGKRWRWLDKHQRAFDGVKEALTSPPVLALPDFTKPFEVWSDASVNGTGAVLMQEGRPVAYTSRKFIPAERNYTTGEQELLGVVRALQEFRCYVEGAEDVTLVTDHNPLTYLQTQKNLSRRQARWMQDLSRFTYKWEYRPGRINVADPISRNPAIMQAVLLLTRRMQQKQEAAPAMQQELTELYDAVKMGYEEDSWFDSIEVSGKKSAKGARKAATFGVQKLDSGFWVKDGKIVVPNVKAVKRLIMAEFHDSPMCGHPGIDRTTDLVERVFWWPSLKQDVREYVMACDSCQRNKPTNQKPHGLLRSLDVPEKKWDSISMDLITQLPPTQSGFDCIVVFVDRLTKMAHFVPTKTAISTEELAKVFVDTVVKLHGVPSSVVTDRDARFTSEFYQQFCNILKTKQRMSTAFHPQTDGQTERMNRVLEETLRHYVSAKQDDWDKFLGLAEFAINNAKNESTGQSPFYMMYGQHPNLPSFVTPDGKLVPAVKTFTNDMQAVLDLARQSIRAAQDRQAAYYNKGREHVTFIPGQQVLLSTKNLRPRTVVGSAADKKTILRHKLLPKFIGPFRVQAHVGPAAVRLELPRNYKMHNVFHVSLVRPYTDNGTMKPPPPCDWLDNGEPLYTVEKILAHSESKQGRKKVMNFKIRWAGYSSEHDTWEPESNLLTCDDLIKEYWARVNAGSHASAAHDEAATDSNDDAHGTLDGVPMQQEHLVAAENNQRGTTEGGRKKRRRRR